LITGVLACVVLHFHALSRYSSVAHIHSVASLTGFRFFGIFACVAATTGELL
jgi:hypothetical protein